MNDAIPPHFQSTLNRFLDHTARIGIFGMGYVGVPLAEAVCRNGFETVGFDVDHEKIRILGQGQSYLKHIDDDRVRLMIESGQFTASTDFSGTNACDAILICVPTPLGSHHEPVLEFIESAAMNLVPHLRQGQLVVLESSTYPGTTNELLCPILERSGLTVDTDFCIAFSPEREDPGNDLYQTSTIPKLVGGRGPTGRKLVETLYGQFIDTVIPVAFPEIAESAKLLENIFREVNIGLVNELKLIFDSLDIDVWEVIAAAATKPFGFMPFYPGPGLGGHCIPLDPFYLTWRAQEQHMPTRFISLAGEINEQMPAHVVARTERALSDTSAIALNGARILIAGVAYKPDVDDCRESPAFEIARLLSERKAVVTYHDPWVESLYDDGDVPFAETSSVPVEAESCYDAVIIATAHSNMDYDRLGKLAPLVVDTQNAMQRSGAKADYIIKA